jgi:hypothetical protein
MNKLMDVQARLFNKSKKNNIYFLKKIETAMTLRLGNLAFKLLWGLFDVIIYIKFRRFIF